VFNGCTTSDERDEVQNFSSVYVTISFVAPCEDHAVCDVRVPHSHQRERGPRKTPRDQSRELIGIVTHSSASLYSAPRGSLATKRRTTNYCPFKQNNVSVVSLVMLQ
jgi:hypothetical protein